MQHVSPDEAVAFIQVKLGHLAAERDRERYLRGLVDLCAQAVSAERCTVYLVDQRRRELFSRVAQLTALEIRLPLGKGIAGTVALTGETVNVPDAYADPRFDRDTDRRSGYRTRNMLVVPVWSTGFPPRVVGVIQVLNRRSGTFERIDQMHLERIADGVAATLERIAPA